MIPSLGHYIRKIALVSTSYESISIKKEPTNWISHFGHLLIAEIRQRFTDSTFCFDTTPARDDVGSGSGWTKTHELDYAYIGASSEVPVIHPFLDWRTRLEDTHLPGQTRIR
ncbi:uncharacterized protein RCO7_14624 [Rhynchosporium graminicola]|uniref:Uncharacterized protein n=1 Tax=Rhynchosporium graminicola TaxID=2792576 RepID=A0A1E1KSH5_9HELO|nr:uncharacterized protein RCO7_14624 [Rhynchosporium commune]